jgi:hypothetical protein
MVLLYKLINKECVKFLILQKFGIKESMQLMICLSNISNKEKRRIDGLLPIWEALNYIENWKSIYVNPGIIPIYSEGILILNGNDILNKKVLNIEDSKFSMMLLMYLPNMWQQQSWLLMKINWP